MNGNEGFSIVAEMSFADGRFSLCGCTTVRGFMLYLCSVDSESLNTNICEGCKRNSTLIDVGLR